MMNAIIISIGDELTIGQTVDTNAAWISQQLAQIGIPVLKQLTLPDDASAITCHLSSTAAMADLLIVTGGLGPTDDDLTRQALADALDVPLELHQNALEQVQAFFDRLSRPMPPTNRVQAMIPRTCEPVPNHAGTAPGIAARIQNTPAFFLPGVPAEMKLMFQQSIRPAREKLLPPEALQRVIRSRSLHTIGISESDLAQRIGDLMQRGCNPLVNCTAAHACVTIRLNATGPNPDAASALLDQAEGQLRQRLGQLIFGRDDDTLAAVVGRLLTDNNATLALAESCTGGMLAHAFTDIPGASQYLLAGWVVYANDAKINTLNVNAADIDIHGAVSETVARQLAQNARALAHADYVLATTGIAGPAGGTPLKPVGLVYIALAGPHDTLVQRCIFPGDRAGVRLRARNAALDLLRKHLLDPAR